jgi:hypothetical protein
LDLAELLHEWAHTFIKFQSGKSVTTPSMYDRDRVQEEEPPQAPVSREARLATDDPDALKNWFEDAMG